MKKVFREFKDLKVIKVMIIPPKVKKDKKDKKEFLQKVKREQRVLIIPRKVKREMIIQPKVKKDKKVKKVLIIPRKVKKVMTTLRHGWLMKLHLYQKIQLQERLAKGLQHTQLTCHKMLLGMGMEWVVLLDLVYQHLQ